MKKIYIALFALLAVGSTFTACTEEEPFATVTENDDPHILAPVFPDRTNYQLATFANISRRCELIHRADRDSERLHHSNLVH